MIFPKKYLFLAFCIIAIYAFIFNELNKHAIVKKNPTNIESNDRSLVYGSSIFSVDNEWYLPEITNLLKGKGFTSNSEKEHYDVRRTPVYPLFYGLHYIAFGEAKSFYFIRFTQILIFALAAIALLLATYNFTQNKAIAIITTALYGFNPTLVSYLYFTITEALSPALVCFLLYFLSRCYIANKKMNWFLTGLFFAFGALCRPSIFFFSTALMFATIYINRKSFRNIITNGLLLAFGAGMLFVPHVVRNYVLTKGDFILLEKYYGDPMNFGLPNIELRNWIACWMNPADYSSEIISSEMINAVLFDSTKTKKEIVEIQMDKLPSRALLVNKQEDIRTAFSCLYDYYFAKYKNANELRTAENSCIAELKNLKKDFVSKAPMQYYIITPILFIKSIVFQSNASTLAILDNYQKSFLKKSIKVVLYLFNIFLFVAMFGSMFFVRKYMLVWFVCLLFTITNIAYCTSVINYFEARYLIPVFPCMYICAAIFFVETIKRFAKTYTSK